LIGIVGLRYTPLLNRLALKGIQLLARGRSAEDAYHGPDLVHGLSFFLGYTPEFVKFVCRRLSSVNRLVFF